MGPQPFRHTPAAAALAAALLAGACTSTPVQQPPWPIAVVPARDAADRVVAVPPECAPVPSTLPDPGIRPGSWHNEGLAMGCSNARNLAVMVDEPRDLLAGRTLGPADGEREVLAIQRYRTGQEKPLQRESTRESSTGAQ